MWTYSNNILSAYTKIYKLLKTNEETTVSLPIQSIKLAFQPKLRLSFQSQQFVATLTKLSLGSTCRVLEVCYAMKLYISECLSSDPFLLCHVVISLGRLSTLYSPCIICHFLLNANMHTPTADTNPLYIFLIISHCLFALLCLISTPCFVICYNKEDAWDKVSCSLIENFLCSPSYLTLWIKVSYTITTITNI